MTYADDPALTVPGMLERSVRAGPERPAVVTADATLTYQQLVDTGRSVGGALAHAAPSPVVALFFPMSPEFAAAYFGVLYAGKRALPLNLRPQSFVYQFGRDSI